MVQTDSKLADVLAMFNLKIGEPFKIQYLHFGELNFSNGTFFVNEWGTIKRIGGRGAEEYNLAQIVTGRIKVRSLYEQLSKFGFAEVDTINNHQGVSQYKNADCICQYAPIGF